MADYGETLHILLDDVSGTGNLVLRSIDLQSGVLLVEEKGRSLLNRRILDKILFLGNDSVYLITPASNIVLADMSVLQGTSSRLLDLELIQHGYNSYAVLRNCALGTGQRQVAAISSGQQAWTRTMKASEGGWVFESLGGRETLQQVFDQYLAIYGPGIAGLTILDAATGTIAWEYHIPKEDYILAVTESAMGLWVCGTVDGHESVVALIGRDGEVKCEAPVAEIACNIAPIGLASDSRCWFMSGAGKGGPNRVYFWDGHTAPQLVLSDIAFRKAVAHSAEGEKIFFLSRFNDQYHVLSADGTVSTNELPIPDRQKNGVELLHITDTQFLVAAREARPSGDIIYIHRIILN